MWYLSICKMYKTNLFSWDLNRKDFQENMLLCKDDTNEFKFSLVLNKITKEEKRNS